MGVFVVATDDEICLCFSLTPTEKEQTDEVLRNEIIKVSTTFTTNKHIVLNPF